jgi:hypothetical protein
VKVRETETKEERKEGKNFTSDQERHSQDNWFSCSLCRFPICRLEIREQSAGNHPAIPYNKNQKWTRLWHLRITFPPTPSNLRKHSSTPLSWAFTKTPEAQSVFNEKGEL